MSHSISRTNDYDDADYELPPVNVNQDDEGNDLGGLMSAIMKKKNKKKNRNTQFDDDDDAAAILAKLDTEEQQAEEKKKPTPRTGGFAALMMDDDGNDDEPEEEEEPVKEDESEPAISHPVTKKNKKKNKQNDPSEEEIDALADKIESGAKINDEEPKEDQFRVKSKKEKEKERKERQKQLKKQQEKKTGKKADVVESESVAEEPATQAPASASAKGKKKTGAPIAALRDFLEKQKAAEEAARLEEEEEQRRIEEEERRVAEEAARKEEEKKEKKEREKQKKEELKKSGKYLTPAQKKQQQIQQAKLQALLQSGGVKVEAFAQKTDENGEPIKKQKPVYGKRKKPNPNNNQEKNNESVNSEGTPAQPKVKDSWDDSDDDEEEAVTPISAATKDDNAPTPSSKSPAAKTVEPKPSNVSDEEEESEEESEDEPAPVPAKNSTAHPPAKPSNPGKDLRSPICCILGHVDTGKTKLLDKIRQTNVQEGEAGGITQQIGATYFPLSALQDKTKNIKEEFEWMIPGLLVIDTPGHESFTNLRSRGSSLCNIAILVVDIMHGLEPQTLESLDLLRRRKSPFIVALNKIDRLYGWKACPDMPVRDSLAQQSKGTIKEFEERVEKTILAFAEQGLNSCLYYDNKNYAKNVSLVPTSAITGEGIPDLLYLITHLTQSRMEQKLMYLSQLECTVLEVKVIEGLGTTIDVILSNGILREGDRICVCGLNGPIVTNIRALLTPQPLRELRVKNAYIKNKEVKAAQGIKISAADLEKAIAGSRLLVIGPDDDEEEAKEEVMEDLENLLTSIDKSGKGVCVQASTLGSLEALLSFLKDMKIPVSGINIGPVHKKDVIRASVMLERAREYAQLLAFDVTIDRDAEQLAEELGVKIFKADIIYHLFDAFTAYMNELQEQKRKDQAPQAVFPCILKIVPGAVFNKRSPLVMGVDVVEGTLRVGTPICVVNAEVCFLQRLSLFSL